jgi:hypothetical protein
MYESVSVPDPIGSVTFGLKDRDMDPDPFSQDTDLDPVNKIFLFRNTDTSIIHRW